MSQENMKLTNPVEARLYTVGEIAQILKISTRKAYDMCHQTEDFKIVRMGKSIRVRKDSFDQWFDSL